MDYTIFLDRIFMFNSNFCINDLYICIFFFTFAKKWLIMLIGFIFSILTATYTLSSNNTVNQEGVVPAYSNYDFERTSTTGKKGQMTEGNTTHLRLSGWDGCAITGVTLEMHSNSKSGAGSMTMKIGKKEVWSIEEEPFSSDSWAGKYSSEWVDISQTMKVVVGNYEMIDIVITATENSLYVNSYTIEYESPPPTCYTVSFVTGMDSVPTSIVQGDIAAPILLPEWRDTAQWYFLGWSEMEINDSRAVPDLWEAGSEYIPRGNTYLWAVYSDVEEVTAVDDYQSGKYVITMWDASTEYYAKTGMAMCGSIVEAEVPLVETNMMLNSLGKCCLMTRIEDHMIYELEFEDSTLSIKHVVSEKPIGHLGTRLDYTENKWQYKVLNDGSLVVYLTDVGSTNTYALRYSVSTNYDERPLVAKVQQMDVANWETDGFWLFPIINPKYTSWPFGKNIIPEEGDLETTSSILSEGTYVMHLGGYVLYVKDKRKYLLPQEVIR